MSRRFFGKWPEGIRTIKIVDQPKMSTVTGRPLLTRRSAAAKPLVRALPNVEFEPLRDFSDGKVE